MAADDKPSATPVTLVRVDPVKCKGYSVCHNLAPDVFLLDEWGFAYVPKGVTVTPENRRMVQKAARACSVNAIDILEPAPPVPPAYKGAK